MLIEDYVSFEVEKLLEEKGFNLDECEVHYDPYNHNEYRITHQMALKWLREVHHIHIEVRLDSMDGIHPIYEALYSECITIRTDNFIDYGDTYEEACEAAIKYCLTNLIK